MLTHTHIHKFNYELKRAKKAIRKRKNSFDITNWSFVKGKEEKQKAERKKLQQKLSFDVDIGLKKIYFSVGKLVFCVIFFVVAAATLLFAYVHALCSEKQ